MVRGDSTIVLEYILCHELPLVHRKSQEARKDRQPTSSLEVTPALWSVADKLEDSEKTSKFQIPYNIIITRRTLSEGEEEGDTSQCPEVNCCSDRCRHNHNKMDIMPNRKSVKGTSLNLSNDTPLNSVI